MPRFIADVDDWPLKTPFKYTVFDTLRGYSVKVKGGAGWARFKTKHAAQVMADKWNRQTSKGVRPKEFSEYQENPAGIKAQVRRLPTGQIQIKIPLKVGRRGNPVSIEGVDGFPLVRGIARIQRYGDTLLKRGNDPKFVAETVRRALGLNVEHAVVIADDGKGGRAYNPRLTMYDAKNLLRRAARKVGLKRVLRKRNSRR